MEKQVRFIIGQGIHIYKYPNIQINSGAVGLNIDIR